MLVGVPLAVFALQAVVCNAANILALVPLPARSHWIIMEPLFRKLASRGHQLTVFSTFPQNPPLANYTDVNFSVQLPILTNKWTLDMVEQELSTPRTAMSYIHRVHTDTCKILQEPLFKDLLKAKGRYDVLITELFGNDCFAYFAHILNIPLITIVTTPASSWAADRTGMPDNPSYIPNLFVSFDHYMTFWQRLYNTVVVVYGKWLYYFPMSKVTRDLAEKSLDQSLPPISDVTSKTSLLLVNSHHSLIQSRPFPPNVIEIGGIHIKERRPLDQDLQTILDNAKSGAIIMSFGSLLKASSIPKSTINSFMDAFSKIPQTIIFKYEDKLADVPPNVVIRKWLSQRDLLEHKNVVAAIVHGGLASTIEVVHVGKPIIGIPVFCDQSFNINNVVRRGACVKLQLKDITEEQISKALSEVINNPKYSQNMKRLSMQFRDRPQTALQSAVYWTEYVIRHKGAPQLRPSSMDLPFYQYLLLDVIGVIVTSLAVLIYTLYRSTCVVKALISRKRNVNIGNKKNN